MIILALDTTTRAGSAAVLRDGAVAAEHIGDSEVTHGERLPADLTRVLDAAAARIEDVDLFAVAAGPGSFTGLRVGIATVQGLAMARGRRVVPVSVLEALARAAAGSGAPVAAWMDAQRGEVFAELYAADGRTVTRPARAASAAVLLEEGLGEELEEGAEAAGSVPVFIGDGAIRYREQIAARYGGAGRIIQPPPLAGIIGQIAAEAPDRAVRPHALMPIYVRRPDAELARARREAGG